MAGTFICAQGAFAADQVAQPEPAGQAERAPAGQAARPVEPEPTFEINEFRIEGNTLIPPARLDDLLDEICGSERGAADVERARDTLEKFYHDEGYPTVLVNIPEQSAETGIIRLQVIESRIGTARVTGNRHFGSDQILRSLPSLAPGTILYLPDVQQQVAKLNRNQDLKVVPAMAPGKALGSVDVELKTEDSSPWHGFLELTNRNTLNTTGLRASGGVHYDNLWAREHSLSLVYQMTPQDPNEVEVVSLSYTLPTPWRPYDNLVFYGVYSNSDTPFGDALHTLGKGHIAGARYLLALPGFGSISQNATLGVDYKNFDEKTGLGGSSGSTAPIQYLPFSVGYSATLPDAQGITSFNAGLSWTFRGAVSDPVQFGEKRFRARGNYATGTLGAERRQKLPGGFEFLLKVDGQLTDQPLVSNEQYSAGGMDSVRGYRESALAGDNAFHAVTELSAPDLAAKIGLGERFQLLPYLFYDCAALWTKDPLPGQDASADLQGTGVGVRGFLWRDLQYQADLAFALSDSGDIVTGDRRFYFKLRYQF